jgi:hypothetical protein
MARLPAGIHLRRPGYRILSALVLGVIVAGVVLLARLFGGVAPSGTSDSPVGAVASPSRTLSSTAGDDSVYRTNSATSEAVPPAAIQAGDAFVRAWLQPTDGRSQEEWYAGLARYAVADLAKQMRDVDPSTNPATTVTGEATGTILTESSARVVVPTNAGPATALCVLTADGWRVATIDLGE